MSIDFNAACFTHKQHVTLGYSWAFGCGANDVAGHKLAITFIELHLGPPCDLRIMRLDAVPEDWLEIETVDAAWSARDKPAAPTWGDVPIIVAARCPICGADTSNAFHMHSP